ncbi:sugar ABC transporter permease [Phycisphaerae bacterium]|jgi:multiple sugar transport system permease protein|nr:sugar ABC transporter permease [Phycisphaerae bacterium]
MNARRTLSWLLLVAFAFAFALPLIWMFLTSVKPGEQTVLAGDGVLSVLPSPISKTPAYAAENFGKVLRDPVVDFPLYLRNTLVVTILTVMGTVVSSAIVAYGFARVQWRGRNVAFGVMLATMMIPFPVIMGPLYVLFKELGWIGTFKPLWVPAWFGHAFSVFLLRQFFLGIPRELNDAAKIDGCNHWQTFTRVILPISKPALTVVALLQFVFAWNDFLGPLIFLTDRNQYTLALGLQLYQSQTGNTPWNLLMAATTIVILPVVIMFLIAQRALIEGIATQGMREA